MRRALCGMAGVAILATGCGEPPPQPKPVPTTRAAYPPQVVNPASTHCLKVGGRLTIEKHPSGGQLGVCLFEDNRQCEEWAMLRGDCPVGGRRITGYATPAGRYCAITGGNYTIVSGSDATDEKGACELPDRRSCDAEEYFHGTCEQES
jgi:putative hemolysin